MGKCCSNTNQPAGIGPVEWFGNMIDNCYEYALRSRSEGKHVVGIMCEYTPRELIMAAGALPVCLCGGSAEMIPFAEKHLPANLCPLIKSTYGYHLQKANPFLEMADMIVAETTCDGKKKMYELMSETRPVYVLELPQKPDDSDAMKHWIAELCKFKTRLEERFGVEITDEKIRKAIQTMNRERYLRRQLAELMKSESPPLRGRELLEFKSIISGIETDFDKYAEAARILKSSANAVDNSGRIRVLMTGVPIVHGAERVLDIIESRGGLVVCMDNCTGLKPILEDVDETSTEPMVALAEKYLHLPCSVMTKNERRLEQLRRLAAQYRPQCIIELIWQACITYDVESYRIRQLAEELGIPYLKIETDYSPSDSARISLRVEALFETINQEPCQEK
ncbi:MAG: 2-hydroxyacyl-CoA dehydratase [Planctomycetes bacterium]|nr:2-hydroxyacyl-CoA dehydratase [Planctomycetota bacterium]